MINLETFPQKKGQSPHEMVSSNVYNSLWSALAVIGGYDRGLRIGSRFLFEHLYFAISILNKDTYFNMINALDSKLESYNKY